MKVKSNVEFASSRFGGTDASTLIAAIRSIPKDATNVKHRVKFTPGDRPWEGETYAIVLEWESDV